jgi:hypothetical protein
MLKVQPAPAVYAVVAMARILWMVGREEPNAADGAIFNSDNEAARRVAFLLKLGGVELRKENEMGNSEKSLTGPSC